jgi:hypothetical protein
MYIYVSLYFNCCWGKAWRETAQTVINDTAITYGIQNLIQHRNAVPNLIQFKHTMSKGVQLKYILYQIIL